MHVNQHHALGIFGEDVDALELRQRIPQRRHVILTRRQCRGTALGQRREELAISTLSFGGIAGRSWPLRLITGPCAAPGRRITLGPLKHAGRQTHFVLPGELASGQSGNLRHRRDAGRCRELIFRPHIPQRTMQRAVKEVMHHAAVAEAHFMLGRMHVDVHHRRVDIEEQHKRRVPAIEQHIAIGLAYRMGHQLVANHAPVDVEILQIRLTAREGRQPDPAPQS